MPLKCISIWSSGSPFVQQSVPFEEQFCEIILNLGQWFRRRKSFKKFLIWCSGGPPAQWSKTNYAILKEGIKGNTHVKLYEIRTSGSGGDVV